jgi:hypothetical protein
MEDCYRPPQNCIDVYVDTIAPPYCCPIEPLTLNYDISFFFAEGSDITPTSFQAQGLASVYYHEVDSVTNTLLGTNVLSRPPLASDLDGSTIKVPIAGVQGSTNSKFDPLTPEQCDSPLMLQDGNVEVYFFAEAGQYVAILEAQFLQSGNIMVCRLKELRNNLLNDDPVPVAFTSVLRYLRLPPRKNVGGPMPLPTPIPNAD